MGASVGATVDTDELLPAVKPTAAIAPKIAKGEIAPKAPAVAVASTMPADASTAPDAATSACASSNSLPCGGKFCTSSSALLLPISSDSFKTEASAAAVGSASCPLCATSLSCSASALSFDCTRPFSDEADSGLTSVAGICFSERSVSLLLLAMSEFLPAAAST